MDRLTIGAFGVGFLIVFIGVMLLSGLSGLPHAAATNLTGMASVIGGAIIVIYGIDRLVKDDEDANKEENPEEEDAN